MTLQVGGHHAHHGAHPYREAYLFCWNTHYMQILTGPLDRLLFAHHSSRSAAMMGLRNAHYVAGLVALQARRCSCCMGPVLANRHSSSASQ